jgi:hypothetical protein
LIATRTGAILDLLSPAGYRAKEMPLLCCHFVFEHQTETSGKKCPGLFDVRSSASPVIINKFQKTFARVTRPIGLEAQSGINGVSR